MTDHTDRAQLILLWDYKMVLPSFLTLFLLLNVALRETKAAVRYAPEVTLKSGKIKGLLDDLNTGGTVRKYLGVPFAKAQRFQAPTDPDPWAGVKDTMSIGKICPQQPTKLETFSLGFSDMTEDCLHLNVFVPHGAGSSLPVMVWIHGGAFIAGSNKIYDGEYIATLGNVIVVAINYRLSMFGFLASGKDGLTGNYGMLDQVHALKWVKNNSKSFGGDPNKVTIFGQSAGGASVGLLVLSPMTKGLFQRAILQSGDANTDWAYKTYSEALDIAKMMAKANGCTNVESLVDCLKDKSFEDVITASKNMTVLGVPFSPVVDGSGGFLPDSPGVLIESEKFADVDIIIGFTNDEGSVSTNAIPGMGNPLVDVKNGLSRSTFTKLLQMSMLVRGQNRVINEAILYLYTDWNNITDPYRNRRMYIDMATDSMFIAPAIKSAKVFVKKTLSKFYMYQLQYRFNTILLKPIPSWIGAYHGADVPVLFGYPFFIAAITNSSVYTKDGNFSRAIITMWTNFAKSGDPNTPEPISLAWPKYDVNQQKFMALKPMFAVQEKPRNSHVAFWNEFVPAALKAMPKPTPAPCVDSNAKALTSGLMILINAAVWSLYLGW